MTYSRRIDNWPHLIDKWCLQLKTRSFGLGEFWKIAHQWIADREFQDTFANRYRTPSRLTNRFLYLTLAEYEWHRLPEKCKNYTTVFRRTRLKNYVASYRLSLQWWSNFKLRFVRRPLIQSQKFFSGTNKKYIEKQVLNLIPWFHRCIKGTAQNLNIADPKARTMKSK